MTVGLATVLLATGVGPSIESRPTSIPWDLRVLSKAPKVFADPTRSVDGVQAMFYEGPLYRGRPTRVFAYYAAPTRKPGEKVPAMVLVHGGGGSAFVPWVKLWASRGYAAIAMDTCGCISSGGFASHPRHPDGGPAGWGGFDQIDDPIPDQWTYHAVADVILANSLLRSFPEVDAGRIGLTGISWGGFLACITAGVDPRFRFVAPVYGCGFIGDNSVFMDDLKAMGEPKRDRWLRLWDPSVYLPRAKMPMLWVDGTTDFAYPMDSLQRSYRLPRSPRTLCVRVNMVHGHGGPGENPAEILAMANAVLKRGSPLTRIRTQGRRGTVAWISYRSRSPIQKVELNYTLDRGAWPQRRWSSRPAEISPGQNRAEAPVPPGTSVYFFNVIDAQGLVVSSEHVEVPAKDSSAGPAKHGELRTANASAPVWSVASDSPKPYG